MTRPRGEGRSPASWPPATADRRSRTTTRATSPAARWSASAMAAGANRAHPQLLQEPRPRPAPGCRGRCRRGGHRRRQPPAARPRLEQPDPAGGAAWRCSTTTRRSTRSPRPGPSTPAAGSSSPACSKRAACPVTGSDGINLWMRVADERSALVTLAAQGIGAAPGEPFRRAPRRATPAGHGRPDRHVTTNGSPSSSPRPPAASSPRGHR